MTRKYPMSSNVSFSLVDYTFHFYSFPKSTLQHSHRLLLFYPFRTSFLRFQYMATLCSPYALFSKLSTKEYNLIHSLTNSQTLETHFSPAKLSNVAVFNALGLVGTIESKGAQRTASLCTSILEIQSQMSELIVQEPDQPKQVKMRERLELGQRVFRTCGDVDLDLEVKGVGLICLKVGAIG